MTKTKKIIFGTIASLGILTASIVTPIVIINENKNNKNENSENKNNKNENSENKNNKNENNENKNNKIISKIKNKDIIIASNISTSNQSEIQTAIKNQLKIENPTLTNEDLSKISTSIDSLKDGEIVRVNINIKIDSKNQKLKIYVIKLDLLKDSNIDNGETGTIFQDKFKNLWTLTYGTKLQVLKANSSKNDYVDTGWTNGDDQTIGKELLKNSNINDGEQGTIFQDSFGNLWSMGEETSLQVLKIKEDDTNYVDTGWVNATNGLLQNSNINDGRGGIIFQDSFKNLWAMAEDSSLQVLKAKQDGSGYVNTGWVNDNNKDNDDYVEDFLIKNSNIDDGYQGTIFQDKFNNLWTMGTNEKLQVLKAKQDGSGYVNTGWVNATNGLLQNSNINNGQGGVIFQDSFNNLWAIGSIGSFQVLKAKQDGSGYVNTGWVNNNDSTTGDNLLKSSNIESGDTLPIFQDKFNNLWTMGTGEKLQVLKAKQDGSGYVNTGWVNNNDPITGDDLLKNSIINNGHDGIIFQDSFKNLWAMGLNKSLQVLKAKQDGSGYLNTGWESATDSGLLNNSNIDNGKSGVIFQDTFENLWTMSENKKLQVLKVNANKDGYVEKWQN